MMSLVILHVQSRHIQDLNFLEMSTTSFKLWFNVFQDNKRLKFEFYNVYHSVQNF